MIEVYIKSLKNQDLEDYILTNQEKLLPDWTLKPHTIVFLFFQCNCALDGTNLFREQIEKDRLLAKFDKISSKFHFACKDNNIISEVICPKEGYPKYSKKGEDIFSIQNIVVYHLELFRKVTQGCGLIHPEWGRAVYPCLMLSLGSIEQIKPIILEILTTEKIDYPLIKVFFDERTGKDDKFKFLPIISDVLN
jgi:hypothetical protein